VLSLFIKKKVKGEQSKGFQDFNGGWEWGGLLVDNKSFVVFVLKSRSGGGEVSGGGTHYM
jgi:hypothetical protein